MKTTTPINILVAKNALASKITISHWKAGLLGIIFLILYLLFNSWKEPTLMLSYMMLYTFPGFLLILILKKPLEVDLLELISKSILLSVGISITLMMICSLSMNLVQLYLPLLLTVYVILVLTLLILNRNQTTKVLCGDVLTSILIFIIIVIFYLIIYMNIFKFYVEDDIETISSSRILMTKGYIYLFSCNNYENPLNYFTGRVPWISLVASFLKVTGIAPSRLFMINPLFIIGIAHAVAASIAKDNKWRFFAAIVTITNPLLLNMSFYLYPELCLAFIMSIFVLDLRHSLERSFDWKDIVTSLTLIVLALIIKWNALIFYSCFMVLIKLVYDRCENLLVKKVIIFAVTLVILYELLVDLPYTYGKYMNRPELEIFDKFAVIKNLEQPALLFFPSKENPQTIFEYSFKDVVKMVYKAIAIEIYSVPILVSVYYGLISILSKRKKELSDWNRYLLHLLLMSFFINVIYNLATDSYGGITKYYTPFIPPFLILGVSNMQFIFNHNSQKNYFVFGAFFSVIIFLINLVIRQCKDVLVVYTVPASLITLSLIDCQSWLCFILFFFILILSSSKIACIHLVSNIRFLKRLKVTINILTLRRNFSFLVTIIVLAYSMIFSSFVLYKSPNITSKLDTDKHIRNLASSLDNTSSKVILLNNFMNIIPYLSDRTLYGEYTAALPLSNLELNYLRDGCNTNTVLVSDKSWGNCFHSILLDSQMREQFFLSLQQFTYFNGFGSIQYIDFYEAKRSQPFKSRYMYHGKICSGYTFSIVNSSLKPSTVRDKLRFNGETWINFVLQNNSKTSQLTYLMWFRPDRDVLQNRSYYLLDISLRDDGHIWMTKGYRDSEASDLFYYFYMSNTHYNYKEESDNILDVNQWAFVAVVLCQEKPVRVYTNGILRFISPYVLNITDTLNIESIKVAFPPQEDSHPWKGYIKDLMVYSRALSTEEVQRIYYSDGSDCPIENLLLRCTFDPRYLKNNQIMDLAMNNKGLIIGKLEESEIIDPKIEVIAPMFMEVNLYDENDNLIFSAFPNENSKVFINLSEYMPHPSINGTIELINNPALKEGYIIEKLQNLKALTKDLPTFKYWRFYDWNATHIAIETEIVSSKPINSIIILSSMRFSKLYLLHIPEGLSKLIFLLSSRVYQPTKLPYGNTFSQFSKIILITDEGTVMQDIIHYDVFCWKFLVTSIFVILFVVRMCLDLYK